MGNIKFKVHKIKFLFSFIGMKSQEISVTSAIINVKMIEDTKELTEVVVTALGIKKRAKSTWICYSTSKRR